MYSKPPRTSWMTGLVAASVVAGSLVAASPALAVSGGTTADANHAFTAKLDIGNGQRSCSGALVDKQWVLTAASCFTAEAGKNDALTDGPPKLKTTVTVGSTDVSGSAGHREDVVELAPYPGRDLVMAKLAKPVAGVTPVAVGTTAPTEGEQLTVTGFGRTKTEWVPDKLHAAAFTVDSVRDGALGLTGKNASVCKGDTGGPALREKDGQVELVAVNSTSWQGGCLGTDPAETRTGAVDARVDDLNDWVSKVRYRGVFPNAPWGKATHVASGYFTGGSAGGTRHMDLIVRWTDAEMTLYQGGDDKDAKHPFVAEYRLAAPNTPKKKSTWDYARQITGASFGNGSDGLVVRWVDGEVTQYTHVDKDGFHGEKMLAKSADWTKATQITAGRYTGNAQRDDLLVVWNDGRVTLHPDLDTNGVKPASQKVLTKANTTWQHATQITSGEFTGKKTADLLVRWSDGEATIYPGVDTAGFHGEIQLRPAKSPWSGATVVGAGAFVANERPNDVIVRWADQSLGIYPGVDAQGTHGEIKLVG
ncbi:S1 family peptidase [Streptomyces paromomycinus]|uniref:Hydrolase n=1 Tax=Streptomyces paromomycinus TaxID=92743 RepID=A0A401VWE6_STREY|nr:trypsin-like serine protease [Streptomyces paromomycinus]GCD41390.1 hydrolase [Streptomyces paromomycinus]